MRRLLTLRSRFRCRKRHFKIDCGGSLTRATTSGRQPRRRTLNSKVSIAPTSSSGEHSQRCRRFDLARAATTAILIPLSDRPDAYWRPGSRNQQVTVLGCSCGSRRNCHGSALQSARSRHDEICVLLRTSMTQTGICGRERSLKLRGDSGLGLEVRKIAVVEQHVFVEGTVLFGCVPNMHFKYPKRAARRREVDVGHRARIVSFMWKFRKSMA
jgi:hypothetical protein